MALLVVWLMAFLVLGEAMLLAYAYREKYKFWVVIASVTKQSLLAEIAALHSQ